MLDLSYKYYHKRNVKSVCLVLHGAGLEGIETPFISSVIDALINTGNSVFGFNFPFCERGEEHSSGERLTEETAALEEVMQLLRSEGYEKIIIVAKSLGGIVTSYWLDQHPNASVEVVILGYVIGSVKSQAIRGKLRLVIQGAKDRFGNAEAVRTELARHDVVANVIELSNADHSYRDEQKQPVYQADAIAILSAHITRM
jgi:predicted alpha/beta-hydrolase family hydrolase